MAWKLVKRESGKKKKKTKTVGKKKAMWSIGPSVHRSIRKAARCGRGKRVERPKWWPEALKGQLKMGDNKGRGQRSQQRRRTVRTRAWFD